MQEVSISLPVNASDSEQIAATELASYLRIIYPDTKFTFNADKAEKFIMLGTPESTPDLLKHVGEDKLRGQESFVVTTATVDGKETGIILGTDPQGVLYGVYGLLEKLGCGFFISFDAVPEPSSEPFSFDKWNLENYPTTPVRIVFNWHNFLSGCSGWDLEQWTSWVDQSQKAGYNTIMVHAYGNNPMFPFTFNGREKPVGYLTSSVKGRDWAVNHVSDVRRLAGGSVFDKPVFGSAAALVPDDQRVQAATELMRKTFEHARQRGVNVNFALDFDIPSCNPQSLVTTLAPEDRFLIRGTWIARPDTPAGYEFYKAQASSIVENYPQITTVTLWRRRDGHGGATWPELKKGEMPESWQKEYDTRIQQNPSAAKLKQSVPAFGMAKVAAAWRMALDELGRKDMELATGSWGFDWVDGCAEFFPESVKLIALDYDVTHNPGEFRDPAIRQRLERSVQPGRFIPVIWAHHDDGQYIGAPLRLYRNFGSELTKWHTGGFGIIHWMTHPLDIFFASHSRQTWVATLDEDAQATAHWMAARCFGEANRKSMGAYLDAWAATMPFFGRETGDFFIDRPMHAFMNPDTARKGYEDRMALLARVDLESMTPAQRDRHAFFVAYEKFVYDFFQTETTFELAKAALAAAGDTHLRGMMQLFHAEGNAGEARALMNECHPEALLERYADALKRIGITRGEEGLIVSMNTRWIPHYVRFRQRLGLDAVRYNYGATSHDSLAQSSGIFTFHVSPDRKLWQTFGQRETQGMERKVRYTFTPVSTQYVRLLCRGNQASAWNSIQEIDGPGIAKATPLTASAAVEGHPARAAMDGHISTRWAAEGEAWIRFALQPDAAMDHLDITWYGHGREYKFDLQVSDDGKTWRTIEYARANPTRANVAVFDSAVRGDGLADEICGQGIQSDAPINIVFAPILPEGSHGEDWLDPLSAGAYTLTLFLVEPDAEAAGQRVMRVEIPRMERKTKYTFAPVKAQYMRLVCRGNQESNWNSIHEIDGPGIAKATPLTASVEVEGHPAQAAADGDIATRWAAEGEAWIRFALQPDAAMDHVNVSWYGQGREYRFDLQISDDGETWRPVEYARAVPAPDMYEVDIFKEAGGRNKPLTLEYRVKLEEPGNPSVQLVPVKGKALVCGAVLEKID